MRELVELGKSDMEFVGSRMRCAADRRAGNDALPRKSCRLRRPRSLDRCLEGIHVPTIVHLCYGYPGGGGQHEYEYPDLLKELMKTRIVGFAVEFARSNYDPKVLEICRGRLVMFGCVDPGDSPAPSVAAVVERVRPALKYVNPENLLLAPDCGLMTISPQLAAAKARALVEAAQEPRRSL